MATDSSVQRQRLDRGEATTTITLPPMPAQPRSSRYRILKLHGRGGMGEIWLAEDEHIGRQVAFKRIRADKVQVLERFFAEAQVTGQLEHPGIVPVHELGRDQDDQPFYVMRMVHGRTLKEVIAEFHAANKRGEPDEELRWLRLLNVMVSLSRTIAFAHSRGVIHRDLKPDNVMVGEYGETFVLDWGLCKLLGQTDSQAHAHAPLVKLSGSHGSSATQDGEVVGSPLYMSPEMADGRIAEEDVRTDVYLLGATLYEVLTNRPPRGGSTQQEIVELARTSPPVPPRMLNPRISRALEAICLKAMAYRSDDRYESAQAVADELERYLAGDPVQAFPEPMVRRTWRWAVRRRALIGRWALAAVLLIVTGASVAAWQHGRIQHAASMREQEAKRQAAEREAANLKLMEDARQDAARFRELEERLHEQLADTTPLDERIGVTDPAAAQSTWKEIQDVIGRWGRGFENLPAEAGRADIQLAYVELVLWRAQSLVAQPLNSARAEELLADFESIADLQPAGFTYHRLRAACLDAAGNTKLAEQALKRSEPLRRVALDYFLEGEQKRIESLANATVEDDDVIGRPSKTFLSEAVAAYQKCLDVDPKHFWARLQKGRSLLVHREQIDSALAELNLAVALRPESRTAWTARGLALGVLNEYPAAIHDLNYAVNLRGSSPTAVLNRGAVFMLQGDKLPQAQNDFAAVLQIDPANLPATYYVAALNYRQQEFAQALANCDKVLQRAPNLRPALLLRVQIALAQKNARQALADLAQLSPPGTAAQQAAAQCSLLRRIAAKETGVARLVALTLALRQGQQAAGGGWKTAALFDDFGAVQMQLRKFDDAIESFKTALSLNPTPILEAKTRLKRGLIYIVEKEDYTSGKADYRKVAEIEGDEPTKQRIRAEAHALLGYIAARQKEPAKADREAALAMAQLRSFNDWEVWRNLGCVYAALADNDSDHQQELQDVAMLMLKNCLFQADQTKSRAKAISEIRGDDALKLLQQRQDFQDLIGPLGAAPATF